jgi:hypothetical protein
MPHPMEWVQVATYRAVYEADIAVATLEGAGIPARVGGGEHVGIFGAGYQGPTTRGVPVLVPARHAEEAREILAEEMTEE